MAKLLTLLIAVSLLTACTSTPQEREAQIASWQKECEAFGYTPNTPEFGNCMMTFNDNYVPPGKKLFRALGAGLGGASSASSNPRTLSGDTINCTTSPGLAGTTHTTCN